MTTYDPAEHPRDTAGKFTEKHNTAPEVILGRKFAISDEENALLSTARNMRLRHERERRELLHHAEGPLRRVLDDLGAKQFTIAQDREEYGIVWWIAEIDGVEHDDFDTSDQRVADILAAVGASGPELESIPGIEREGHGRWTFQ